jgi:T4 superinfection immunity protein
MSDLMKAISLIFTLAGLLVISSVAYCDQPGVCGTLERPIRFIRSSEVAPANQSGSVLVLKPRGKIRALHRRWIANHCGTFPDLREPAPSTASDAIPPSESSMDVSGGVALLFLIVIFLVYFLPGIVSAARHHPNADAIFILNLFLGWTILGWVIALVWACTYVGPSEDAHDRNLREALDGEREELRRAGINRA